MGEPKSFYDLDYLIEMGEKRVDQFTGAYQLVIGRLTNIILVYSVIGIYIITIIQDWFEKKEWFSGICVALLLTFVITSIVYTVRLLFPVNIAYLQHSKHYYQDLRIEYEKELITDETTPEQKPVMQEKINTLLKASYIDELAQAQTTNFYVFTRKSSFYYNALIFGLLAIAPYVICIGFHFTKKEEKVQKIEIVPSKNSTLHS